MKALFILLFFFTPHVFCAQKNMCSLDYYIAKSKEYKLQVLANKELELNNERNDLSLLPDVFVGVGQYSNNNYSFKSVDNSSLSLGISQQIYQGNIYKKNKEFIEITKEYGQSVFIDERNILLLRLFSHISEYKYKKELLTYYHNQLKRQLSEFYRVSDAVKSGSIAEVELSIAKQRVENIKLEILGLEYEKDEIFNFIYENYNLPPEIIDSINIDVINDCKVGNYYENKLKSYKLQLAQVMSNKEVTDASSSPSLGVSLSITPPGAGILNQLTTKKANFAASINLSIPMSQIFLQNNSQKRLAIDIEKIRINHEHELNNWKRNKKQIENKISLLSFALSQKKASLDIENKKAEYILNRVKDGKDTLISYYRQIENLNSIEINIKQKEKELDIQKASLYFID
ncbi:TolC family protein [Escherichia coli]|uniref:TolC family protein n=1 Tax=Escherichia coli TaxID=562 RepID=UPI00234CA17D|nr:TolC family protein [Escherichia coli]MDC6936191.1 TolC family protein [Escherichia coli]MDC7061807.1 TolC family protein [Escherichia coli]MDC7083059.1 TolC family protein [Escherichia coli]